MSDALSVRHPYAWMPALAKQWLLAYCRNNGESDTLYVYRHVADGRRVQILRNDAAWPDGREMAIPNLGTMRCYELLDDPALATARDILQRYGSYKVLRYRPGKRLTVAVDDPDYGPAILKCVAKGVDGIYERLRELYQVRARLDFRVSQPYAKNRDETVFMQQHLRGLEPRFERESESRRLAARFAAATASLHGSNAVFAATFGTADQRRRSERYAVIMRRKFPSLGDTVDALSEDLASLERRIAARPTSVVPIHGSLHSHQWLTHDDGLALVDFDRAAMGHAELDIATFLAEWDYEPGTISESIKQEFLDGFSAFDESLLNYYRAHKHLAKAFKAAKGVDSMSARTKCRRYLGTARQLLN